MYNRNADRKNKNLTIKYEKTKEKWRENKGKIWKNDFEKKEN